MDSDWCVIRVKSGSESKMISIINSYYSSGVVDIFAPCLYNPNSSEKDKKRVKTPFPGYVFVKIKPGSAFLEKIGHMQVLPYKISSIGDEPSFISDDEIKKIRSSIASFQEGSNFGGFSVGAKVQISHGPFESYHGVVEEIYPKVQKAKVKVVFCGQNVLVTFNFDQLKLID